ncbi:MAG: hypothetical protein MZW92_05730 [Comamonadaceae bacterium]|nr:hypothetical protein [Comamonadaceae bacterium]
MVFPVAARRPSVYDPARSGGLLEYVALDLVVAEWRDGGWKPGQVAERADAARRWGVPVLPRPHRQEHLRTPPIPRGSWRTAFRAAGQGR